MNIKRPVTMRLWNGQEQYGDFVSSGLYIYTLKQGDHVLSGKMAFLKRGKLSGGFGLKVGSLKTCMKQEKGCTPKFTGELWGIVVKGEIMVKTQNLKYVNSGP